MKSFDWDRDPDQRDHLLLAMSYAVLSGAKSTHQVFRDAYLAPSATTPTANSLPDDVNCRIQNVVETRDITGVGHEFDIILGVPTLLSAAERVVMGLTFEGILAHGRELIEEYDVEGARQFVAKIDSWAAAKRKKGNQGWRRPFLNRFAYECKVAFYACFANAWIDIILVLSKDYGLDPVSERFLRVWHMQNPPDTDVFHGQVLSLHPLSRFFMQDPALLASAGRFFGTDAYLRVFKHGEADVPEYWNLVGAILTAGHQYRQVLDRYEARRGADHEVTFQGGEATSEGTSSAHGLLEDYVSDQGIRCLGCQGALRLGNVASSESDSQAHITFTCQSCRQDVPLVVRRDDLCRWFLDGE